MPLEGNIKPVMVIGADPAANTEVADTVPTTEMWEVLGVVLTLVTDANVANRLVTVSFTDANDVPIWETQNGTNITASLTAKIEGTTGSKPSDVSASLQYIALPNPLVLGPGCKIKTVTANRQAGDNFGTTKYWVRKYTPVS